MKIKDVASSSAVLCSILVGSFTPTASAHIPLVEPERFRNDDFSTEGGFAERQ